MKKSIVLFVFMGFVNLVHAQTWDEFFNQKNTQKKYLLEQIAALQVYTEYLTKGYNILHAGLTTINNIKHGDFNVFTTFFGSLSNINPAIRHYAKAADIIAMQLQIVQQSSGMIKQARANAIATELPYITKVFENLLDGCNALLDELISITSSNQLQMTDDERIKRIDAMYLDMRDKQMFCSHFSDGMRLLFAGRAKEGNNIADSRALYGVK